MFNFDENTKFVFDSNSNNVNCVQDKICPKCGMSLIEVQRNGIVGCANCYSVFETEIKNLIFRKQGTINHIGKISSKHFSKIKLKEKIAQLERDKDLAIQNENYIVAESLKNQIEKLKGEL